MTENTLTTLTANTSELKGGDVVLTHGMRVRLPAEPRIYQSQGSTVYAWDGTVENLDEVLGAGFIPRSYLCEDRWDTEKGWMADLTGRWIVQGNELATWNVERGAAPVSSAPNDVVSSVTVHAVYGWIIDKDLLYSGDPKDRNDHGTTGPRDISPEIEAHLMNGEGTEFMIYDDDGEHYYSGRIIGPDAGSAAENDYPEWDFGPLWDFGTPNAGATEIRYKNKAGKWKSL